MTITPQEIEEVTTLTVACMGDLENRNEENNNNIVSKILIIF